MLRPNELRIGNYVEYRIEDELDDRKEWWELSIIDSTDLQILEKGIDSDYRPIELTEEILLKFAFEILNPNYLEYKLKDGRILFDRKAKDFLLISSNINYGKKIKYAHKLQNYIFENTEGEELKYS